MKLGKCPHCGADLTEQIKDDIHAGVYLIESNCEVCDKPIWLSYSVMVDCEITKIDPNAPVFPSLPKLVWSPWTSGAFEMTACQDGEAVAVINACTPDASNGWRNRQWAVKRGDVVLGKGYTSGTESAEKACIALLRPFGEE